jgi:hypothetical protein
VHYRGCAPRSTSFETVRPAVISVPSVPVSSLPGKCNDTPIRVLKNNKEIFLDSVLSLCRSRQLPALKVGSWNGCL